MRRISFVKSHLCSRHLNIVPFRTTSCCVLEQWLLFFIPQQRLKEAFLKNKVIQIQSSVWQKLEAQFVKFTFCSVTGYITPVSSQADIVCVCVWTWVSSHPCVFSCVYVKIYWKFCDMSSCIKQLFMPSCIMGFDNSCSWYGKRGCPHCMERVRCFGRKPTAVKVFRCRHISLKC